MTKGRALVVVSVIALVFANATLVFALILDAHPAAPPHPGWVRAASVRDAEARHVVFAPGADAYIVDTPAGFKALIARSTQLGEPVRYCVSSGWFQDLDHGSVFDGRGRYVFGPAPRGLDEFAVHVLDGRLWIDTTTITPGPPRGAHDHQSGPMCWRHD